MGCDIHCFIEATDEDGRYGEDWYLVAILDIERSYTLFGHLAGVRRPEYKLFDPKGMPNDIGAVGREFLFEESYAEDGHNASWLTLDEVQQVQVAMGGDEDLEIVITIMQTLLRQGKESRFVFFFDN